MCRRPWGAPPGGSDGSECHLTSGDSSVHLTGACQQYITASGRAFAQLFTHILHRHAYSNLQCLHKCVSLCFQGQALVGSPLSLAQVQAEGCALYHSCEVCARARSLGCVWSDKACILTTAEWVRLEYHNEVEDFQKSKADCSTAGVENGSVTLCVNTEPFSLQQAQNMLRFQAF